MGIHEEYDWREAMMLGSTYIAPSGTRCQCVASGDICTNRHADGSDFCDWCGNLHLPEYAGYHLKPIRSAHPANSRN